MSALRWQTPSQTEVPLDNDRQRIELDHILTLNDPEEDGEFHNDVEYWPDKDILAALPATRVTLAPMADCPWMNLLLLVSPLWFQLAKSDRRALQTVYIHDRLNVILNQSIKREPKSAADWLRWIAVREAHREESLKSAFKTASDRLKDTPAEGQPGTMKRAYDRVRHTLENDLSTVIGTG